MKITLSGGPVGGTEIEREPSNGEVVDIAGRDEWDNETVFQYRIDVHPKSRQVSAVYIGERG